LADNMTKHQLPRLKKLILTVKNSGVFTSYRVKEIISIAVDILQTVMNLIGLFKAA